MDEDFVLYVCWKCGRTIRWPKISYCRPSTDCQHDGIVYLMDIIEPPKKED